jgi:hypothetical protein
MEKNCFEFIDNSSPDDVKEILFSMDEISAIEKTLIPAVHEKDNLSARPEQYVVVIYTKNNIFGKKSNCMVLTFENKTQRDKAYENLKALLNPTTFEAKWFLA